MFPICGSNSRASECEFQRLTFVEHCCGHPNITDENTYFKPKEVVDVNQNSEVWNVKFSDV